MIYELKENSNSEAFALLEKAKIKEVKLSFHQKTIKSQSIILNEGIVTKRQVQDLNEKYIRLIHQNKLGYFKYNMSPKNLDDLLAGAILSSQFTDEINFSFPGPMNLQNPQIFDSNIATMSSSDLKRMGHSICEYIKDQDHTLQSDLSIGKEVSNSEIVNTANLAKGYNKTGFFCHIWLKKPIDSRVILNYDNLQSCELISVKPLINIMLEEISWSYHQVHLPQNDVMPVILSPSILSQIFKTFVSFFNAQYICQNASLIDPSQIGKKIFDERITIRDDGITDWKTQSKPFDAEGIPTQSHNLIEKGKINHFLCDLKHARQLNMKPTGNFRFVHSKPEVFMNNVTIDNGILDFKSILKNVVHGLYIGTGMVQWESHTNIKIIPSNSYLIENGEIAGTVVEHFQLAGVFSEVFNKIIEISKETKITKNGMEIPYIALEGFKILK